MLLAGLGSPWAAVRPEEVDISTELELEEKAGSIRSDPGSTFVGGRSEMRLRTWEDISVSGFSSVLGFRSNNLRLKKDKNCLQKTVLKNVFRIVQML